MTEQGCFGLKKGADPPAVIRSAPLGVWGLVGVKSRGSGKRNFAVGCVEVRACLAMDVEWEHEMENVVSQRSREQYEQFGGLVLAQTEQGALWGCQEI